MCGTEKAENRPPRGGAAENILGRLRRNFGWGRLRGGSLWRRRGGKHQHHDDDDGSFQRFQSLFPCAPRMYDSPTGMSFVSDVAHGVTLRIFFGDALSENCQNCQLTCTRSARKLVTLVRSCPLRMKAIMEGACARREESQER